MTQAAAAASHRYRRRRRLHGCWRGAAAPAQPTCRSRPRRSCCGVWGTGGGAGRDGADLQGPPVAARRSQACLRHSPILGAALLAAGGPRLPPPLLGPPALGRPQQQERPQHGPQLRTHCWRAWAGRSRPLVLAAAAALRRVPAWRHRARMHRLGPAVAGLCAAGPVVRADAERINAFLASELSSRLPREGGGLTWHRPWAGSIKGAGIKEGHCDAARSKTATHTTAENRTRAWSVARTYAHGCAAACRRRLRRRRRHRERRPAGLLASHLQEPPPVSTRCHRSQRGVEGVSICLAAPTRLARGGA